MSIVILFKITFRNISSITYNPNKAINKISLLLYLGFSFHNIFSPILQVTDLVEGVIQDVLTNFKKILNFQVQQFKRFDGGWGTLDKDTGKWTGMISNIEKGEADLGVAPLTACCRRWEVLDFVWTITQSWETFGIKG